MKRATTLAIIIAFLIPQLSRATSPELERVSFNDTVTFVKPSIHDLFMDIIRVTGLHANFTLKEAKVMNIEAAISHKKRYIYYNKSFMDGINKATLDKWSCIALLAHEIGHHLNGHTIKKGGSTPALELEADEFAGFVLFRLGATLQQAQKVLRYISDEQGSSTHPGRNLRLEAIKKGWDQAGAL